jgi:hypothetical protein
MLVIVPCGSAKLRVPDRADRLYTGNYHRACLAWARSVAPAPSIFILSAKYGLVGLDQVIEPYEPGLMRQLEAAP